MSFEQPHDPDSTEPEDRTPSSLHRWLQAHPEDEVFAQPGPTEVFDESLPVVVVDFDATLHHYFDAVRLHPKCPPIPHEDFEDYYSFRAMVGMDLWREISSDCDALDRMIEVGLYPGAVEAMAELAKIANIIVMSHRTLHHGPNVSKALAHHDVPHMCFLVGAVDKVAFCKDHGVSLLIDDKPSTLISAYEQGVQTATIIQSYNRTLVKELGIPAGEQWEELWSQIQTLLLNS